MEPLRGGDASVHLTQGHGPNCVELRLHENIHLYLKSLLGAFAGQRGVRVASAQLFDILT